MSTVLGLNTHHAGSSAALVVDGQVVFAVAEERLNRVKYYAGFPRLAIRECLNFAGLRFRDLDHVAVGREPSANRAKKIEYVLAHPTRLLNLLKIRASRAALDDVKGLVVEHCDVDPAELRFEQINVEHHLAHIASAFFIAPWDKAAGFSMDGSGDFVTCMLADCEGDRIEVKKRVYVPHSLGSLYTMICEFIGYNQYGDEGKVMGLAPYGTSRYQSTFDDMVELTNDGFQLNPKYFMPFGSSQGITIDERGQVVLSRHYGEPMVNQFGPPRRRHAAIEQRDRDLAYGLQRKFEDGYMHMLNVLHRLVPRDRVAMAGGCALNSVANGKLFDLTPFRETCIQPAASDDGLAIGAALYHSRANLHEPASSALGQAFLGNEYSEPQIRKALDAAGVRYERREREPLLDATVDEIMLGNVVGWFQGRMEWGPRALGNRSIVAHPGLPDMKDVLNARIKHRESFRPFAPSVLVEYTAELFEKSHPSPFMLHVYKIKPVWRERLCAVNHVDDTGRLQTVARSENALYYDLIDKFRQKSGIPVLLNTSFNENEPIVCRPEEAIDCFARTKMDALAIGPFLCRKRDQ